MKTFIAAIIIFVLLFASVMLVSGFVRGRISALSAMASELPECGLITPDEGERVKALHAEWEMNMRFLGYFVSYDILHSAGEAADAITAAALTESRDDLASARLRFIAAMRRLELLFSVSPESVF